MENGKVLWAMSAGRPQGAERLECGLFEKELLRVGRWVHPARKFVLEVTPERLANWAKSFKRMLAKGIRVPVPYGHSYDPRDNAGFLKDMYVLGDRLVGVLEIPRDEDAARLGSVAADVSVSVNPDFTDGQGERFGEVIEHVAITNYPVVAGQADFVALGSDGETSEIVTLEMDRGGRDREESRPAETEADASEDRKANGAGESSSLAVSPSPKGEGTSSGAGGGEPAGDGGELERADDSASGEPLPLAAKLPDAREERDALLRRIGELEEDRVDREVESLVMSGRIAPAVEGHVRRLLSIGERIQLSAAGESVSPPEELRAILEAIPEGAWVPLAARQSAARTLERRESEVSHERARELARENVRMLLKGGDDDSQD